MSFNPQYKIALFPLVTNQAELHQAILDYAYNVKVNCPICQKERIVSVGSASELLDNGCQTCNMITVTCPGCGKPKTAPLSVARAIETDGCHQCQRRELQKLSVTSKMVPYEI